MPRTPRFPELGEFSIDSPASAETAKASGHQCWLLLVVLLGIAQPAAAGPNNAIDCSDPHTDDRLLACIDKMANSARITGNAFVKKQLGSDKEFALYNLSQAALSPDPKTRRLAQRWLLKTRHLNRSGVKALPKWKKLVGIIKQIDEQNLHRGASRRSSHRAHAKSYTTELAAECHVEKQTTPRDVTLKCVSKRCVGRCFTETTTVSFVTGPRGIRNQSAVVAANDNDHSCGICY